MDDAVKQMLAVAAGDGGEEAMANWLSHRLGDR